MRNCNFIQTFSMDFHISHPINNNNNRLFYYRLLFFIFFFCVQMKIREPFEWLTRYGFSIRIQKTKIYVYFKLCIQLLASSWTLLAIDAVMTIIRHTAYMYVMHTYTNPPLAHTACTHCTHSSDIGEKKSIISW